MRSLLLFLAALVVSAACAEELPRFVLEPSNATAIQNGQKTRVIFSGNGAKQSQPYCANFISGHFNPATNADSVLYVVLTSTTAQTEEVDAFLEDYHAAVALGQPSTLSEVMEQSAQIDGCQVFLERPNVEGHFIFIVDAYRHPDMKTMSIVDGNGVIALRKPILEGAP